MYPVLRPLLNKGGAGRYATREETIERLNPLIRLHHMLLRSYDDTLAGLNNVGAREQVEMLMPRARTQSGKLSETVFSLGGTPPNGTDFEPTCLMPTRSDNELLHYVLDLERDYSEVVSEEIDAIHHQERTRAILKVVKDGSEVRQDVLRSIAIRLPQPARD